jgi:hypothetical protein
VGKKTKVLEGIFKFQPYRILGGPNIGIGSSFYYLNRNSVYDWLTHHNQSYKDFKSLDDQTIVNMINTVLDEIKTKQNLNSSPDRTEVDPKSESGLGHASSGVSINSQTTFQPIKIKTAESNDPQEIQKRLPNSNTDFAIHTFGKRLGSREAYLKLPILDLSSLGTRTIIISTANGDETITRPIWVGYTNYPDSIPLSAVKNPVTRGINGFDHYEYLIIKYDVNGEKAIWVMAQGDTTNCYVSCSVHGSGSAYDLCSVISAIRIPKSKEELNQLSNSDKMDCNKTYLSWNEKFKILMQTGSLSDEKYTIRLDASNEELNEYLKIFETNPKT